MNLLIAGGRAPSALYLTRLFAKAEHKVYVADCNSSYITMYSKYTTKSFHISSPRFFPEKYIRDLEFILKEYHIEMLIPTCEEVFYISRAKETLEKYCSIFCDEFYKLVKLHNKFEFINYLENINVRHPSTILIDNKKDLKIALEKHFALSNAKVILKPVFSRFSSQVIIINNFIELDKMKENSISTNRTWVMQEFIEGNQVCCYCICNNGEILAYSDYNTIFTAGLGTNIYFEYANNGATKLCCEKIVRSMNFTGQIAFDFIINHNGDVYPIECNPRTTSGVHLFGYNNYLEKAFIQNEYVEIKNMDTWSLKIALLFKFRNLRKWISCMLHSKDVIYLKNDMKPAFMQGIIFIKNIFDALLHFKNLIEITTIDIEFDGEQTNRFVEGGRV